MFINVYKRLKFVTYGSFSLTYIHLGRGYWEIPNIKNGIYANYFINNPSLLFPPPKLIKKDGGLLKEAISQSVSPPPWFRATTKICNAFIRFEAAIGSIAYRYLVTMNQFWKQLVIQTVLKKRKKSPKDGKYSDFELAKGMRELRLTIVRQIKDFLLITMGIFSAAFGFKGFLLSNQFIDGGATGISLLISALTSVPLYILLLLVNSPFIILGYTVIGRSFAVKTALAICGLALVVATVTFPEITNDKLLVALFGGFFLGAGIGLAVRGGAVIDGTEVLAIFLSRKFGTTIGDIIIMINIVIFSTAAYFLSIEIALYSMVTYLSASKTLDFIIEGIEEYTGVTIISSHSDEIRQMIIEKIGRGVTVYNGKRGFGKKGEAKDIEIVYTVVTRLELNRLNAEIQKIDKNAFVVMSSIKDTKGGMIKKRPLKH